MLDTVLPNDMCGEGGRGPNVVHRLNANTHLEWIQRQEGPRSPDLLSKRKQWPVRGRRRSDELFLAITSKREEKREEGGCKEEGGGGRVGVWLTDTTSGWGALRVDEEHSLSIMYPVPNYLDGIPCRSLSVNK